MNGVNMATHFSGGTGLRPGSGLGLGLGLDDPPLGGGGGTSDGPSGLLTNGMAGRPPKRASNTCVTCRARKVRCDGRRDVCNNCERLGFACSYDDGAGLQGGLEVVGSDGVPHFALPRRRVRQACINCHSRKARCSGTIPKCDRCLAQGIECVYRPGKRIRMGGGGGSSSASAAPVSRGGSVTSINGNAGGSGGGGPGPGSGGGGPGIGGDVVMSDRPTSYPEREDRLSDRTRSVSSEHGDLTSATSPSNFGHDLLWPEEGGQEALTLRTFGNFFRHVHHVPVFSFIHHASLMQRYHAGLVDRALLLGMIGITSLMTDLGPGTRDFGSKCVDECEAMILRELDKPSTLRLQALVLIIKHRMLCRRFSSAFMLTSLASRFAAALRLNYENPNLCFLAQESRRRLMWALYMIDAGIAGGSPDFSLWAQQAERIHIQLPCNERNFDFDLPETVESLQPPPPLPDGSLPPLPDDIGWLALHIRCHWIRSRILQYTKALVADPTPAELAVVPARCAELAGELNDFVLRLPTSFNWTESNVRLRAYSPRLCVFFMTHVWWQQCHCDLYRIALVGLREGLGREAVAQLEAMHPDFVRHCQKEVFEHARAVADMMAMILSMGSSSIPVCDLDLSVCNYQCVRMLYYVQQLPNSRALFGITTEGVREMANVCLRVLKTSTVTAPAMLGIRADLEKLMANGISMISEPSPVATPEPAQGPEDGLQEPVLRRHNYIQNVINDDNSEVVVAPAMPATGRSPTVGAGALRRQLPSGMTSAGNTPPMLPPTQYSPQQLQLQQLQQLNHNQNHQRQQHQPQSLPTPTTQHLPSPYQQQQPPPPPPSPQQPQRQPSASFQQQGPLDGQGTSVNGNGNGNGKGKGNQNNNTKPSGAISTGTAAQSTTSNAFDGALEGLDFGGMEPFGMDSLSWFSSEWLNTEFPAADTAAAAAAAAAGGGNGTSVSAAPPGEDGGGMTIRPGAGGPGM